MATTTAPGATIPGATHEFLEVDGFPLHVVSAGSTGSPVLLVHGWPETWWAFRGLMPLLAATHRVFALDLRGFGDSGHEPGDYGPGASARDLRAVVDHLGLGPVHLLAQDIGGGPAFRFAATHPDRVRSVTAVESTLPGFGLETLGDVAHGGSWHLGFLAAPGVPDMLLPGHERQFLGGWAYPGMGAGPDVVTPADLDEFVRTYSRPDAWRGTAGLYQAVFADAGETPRLAAEHPLQVPVLAVDGASHPFTANTFRQLSAGEITAVHLDGVGHLVAQEAPERLAAVVLPFLERVDGSDGQAGRGTERPPAR